MSDLSTYKKRLKSSLDFCEPHWDRSIDNYKHYLGRLDVGGASLEQYPFNSKLTIPISYEIVETAFPRIIGKDPEFATTAISPEDVSYEGTAKTVIDMEYNNPKLDLRGEPIYVKLQRMVKELLITGNAVGRSYWRRETVKRKTYEANLPIIQKSGPIKEIMEIAKMLGREKEVTFTGKMVDMPFLDDYDLHHVPFFMFLPDDSFWEPGKMRYKIERQFMTFEQLADESALFKYEKSMMDELSNMEGKDRSSFTPDYSKNFMYEYNELFNDPFGKKLFASDDDKVHMFIVDKVWEGDRVHVFVNEKFQLTPENGSPNPYDIMTDPFIYASDNLIPHSYFAYGEIDAIRKLEDAATDMWNMRFDNLIQSMLNMYLVNPKMIHADDEFMPIPNTITNVKDIDKAVGIVSGRDVTQGAFQEVNQLVSLMKNMSGVDDYTKGSEGATIGGRTYGGMRLIQEVANARFVVKSRLFEKLTLKSLGYSILEFSRQFFDADRTARLTGEQGTRDLKVEVADLKSIRGFMDIRVTPDSAMVVDQQADAMRMNAVADRLTVGKGPFANVPEEVYDMFFTKYLQAYGIHDAPLWARQRREAREKLGNPSEQTQPEPTPQGIPSPLPPQGQPVMQSDQIAQQPNPLEMILNAGSGGPLPTPQAPQQTPVSQPVNLNGFM